MLFINRKIQIQLLIYKLWVWLIGFALTKGDL
jgi:hypothetical protein